MVQQVGLVAQTEPMQVLQPALSAMPTSHAGCVHDGGGPQSAVQAESASAVATQPAVHELVQQAESRAQTAAVQGLQPVLSATPDMQGECGQTGVLPPQVVPHSMFASETHAASQSVVQQKSSAAQTVVAQGSHDATSGVAGKPISHGELAQAPGMQLKVHAAVVSTASTHAELQVLEQQSGVAAQIAVTHGSHVELSAAPVAHTACAQGIGAPPQRPAQAGVLVARPTQSGSQSVAQQNASAVQTAVVQASQVATSGTPATQGEWAQVLPQSESHTASASAAAAQAAVQLPVQQLGVAAQTAAVQLLQVDASATPDTQGEWVQAGAGPQTPEQTGMVSAAVTHAAVHSSMQHSGETAQMPVVQASQASSSGAPRSQTECVQAGTQTVGQRPCARMVQSASHVEEQQLTSLAQTSVTHGLQPLVNAEPVLHGLCVQPAMQESSTTPSQSSSMVLQISVVGMPGTALQAPAMPELSQVVTPARSHAPMPRVQATPVPAKPSSVMPSQSSSSPLQSSAEPVPGMPAQMTPSPGTLQMFAPLRMQAPTPMLQVAPSVVKVSSVVPSQSSSMLLQRSAIAAPGAGLQVTPVRAGLHTSTPARKHAPTPPEQVMPSVVKFSSVMPSQSSSKALQISAIGAPATALHATPSPAVLHASTPIAPQSPTPALHSVPRSA